MAYLIPIYLLSFLGIFNLLGINRNLALDQILFLVIGSFIFLVTKKIGWRFFKKNSHFFYWVILTLLIITHFFGLHVKGSTRWLRFAFLTFQPSELAKIFLLIILANNLAKIKIRTNQLVIFLKNFFYFLFPVLLIYKQPDLGTVIVFFIIYFSLNFISRLNKKYLFYLILLLLIISPIGWFLMHDYQRARLLTFINPQADYQGTAYNMIQSIITIGSGGFLGKGLGFGTQTRLSFLPENHTDFAFASLVEQFGFLGGFLIITLFSSLVFILLKKAHSYLKKNFQEEENFLFLYTSGFAYLIFFQFFINVGMNLGILPISGIALPFISSGGSSMISLFFAFGLLN